jgi:hypothetical protein
MPLHPPSTPQRYTASYLAAIAAFLLVLLALGGFTGWMAVSAVQEGQTTVPAKAASQRRPVLRAKEPAFFMLCTSLYAGVSLASLGFAAWLVRTSITSRPR